jgi:hypothetical protein
MNLSLLSFLMALATASCFSPIQPHTHQAVARLSSQRQQSARLFNAPKTSTESSSEEAASAESSAPKSASASQAILDEANDALANVGWAPLREEGELTSDDPFVQEIDAGIQRDFGVSLEELLNPAKVVNLERDLYNLRLELAEATNVNLEQLQEESSSSTALTTELCDGGGGGEEVDAIRAKIAKKEKDLLIERRAVFRGWLKNVFLGQAILSFGLSWVMATQPEVLFGSFGWFNSYNM